MCDALAGNLLGGGSERTKLFQSRFPARLTLFPFLSWRRLLRMDQNPFGCLVPDIRLSLCLYFPCDKPFMPISGYKMKLPAVTGRSFCLQVLLFCCFTAHIHTGLHRINLLFRYLIKVSVPSSSESKVISD